MVELPNDLVGYLSTFLLPREYSILSRLCRRFHRALTQERILHAAKVRYCTRVYTIVTNRLLTAYILPNCLFYGPQRQYYLADRSIGLDDQSIRYFSEKGEISFRAWSIHPAIDDLEPTPGFWITSSRLQRFLEFPITEISNPMFWYDYHDDLEKIYPELELDFDQPDYIPRGGSAGGPHGGSAGGLDGGFSLDCFTRPCLSLYPKTSCYLYGTCFGKADSQGYNLCQGYWQTSYVLKREHGALAVVHTQMFQEGLHHGISTIKARRNGKTYTLIKNRYDRDRLTSRRITYPIVLTENH